MPLGRWTRGDRSGLSRREMPALALISYGTVWTALIISAGLLVGRLLRHQHALIGLAAEIGTTGVLLLCAGFLALPTLRVATRLGAHARRRRCLLSRRASACRRSW